MGSPTCEVKDGAAAYVSTTGGVDVTPGNTVVIRLASQADVDLWAIECLTTDELSDKDAINLALSIDNVAKTATFIAPVAGRAYRFQSRVGNLALGRDRNNVWQPAFTATFAVYTKVGGGRVHAKDETTEGNTVAGWGADINDVQRRDIAMTNGANIDNSVNALADTPFAIYANANEEWELEFEGSVQCNNTGGVKFGVSGPAGATVDGWFFSTTNALATPSTPQRITALATATATATHTVANVPAPDRLRARVKVSSTPGVIAIQMQPNTNGQQARIFPGAKFRARRVIAAN